MHGVVDHGVVDAVRGVELGWFGAERVGVDGDDGWLP